MLEHHGPWEILLSRKHGGEQYLLVIGGQFGRKGTQDALKKVAAKSENQDEMSSFTLFLV